MDHWYLFLTFRAQEQHSNQEANAQLESIVMGNLQRADFKSSYGNRAAPGKLRLRLYPEFLRLGIGKLIAGKARAKNLGVAVKSSWLYGRSVREYYIVKLVLRFDRIQKPTDLPDPHRASMAYDEAIHAFFKSRPTNVDGVGKAEKEQVVRDLNGVIAELEKAGIIS